MGSRRVRRALLVVALATLAVGGAALVVARRGESKRDADSDEMPAGSSGAVLAAAPSTTPLPPPPPGIRTDAATRVVEPVGLVSIEPSPSAIVGVVLEPDGRPATGRIVRVDVAWLHADEFAPYPSDADVRPHRVDAKGQFRFDPMPSSGVRLQVADDPVVVSGVVAATPGVVTTIRLRLRPWHVVTVVDSLGAPIAQTSVSTWAPEDGGDGETARVAGVAPKDLGRITWLLIEPRGRGFSRDPRFSAALTDASGRARIAPILEDHPCRLDVGPASGGGRAFAFVPRRIEPWSPKDDTVVLRRVRTVEGMVRDLRGEPVVDGEIRWEGMDGAKGMARVEFDGKFLLTGVPEGPVTLEYALGSATLPKNAGRRTANAGDESVDVRVDLGASLVVRVAGWPRVAGGVVHATREGEGPLERSSADLDPDGEARLRGLRDDAAYTVWIPPTVADLQGDGAWRHAYREHVRVADSPVGVKLADGAALEARIPSASAARVRTSPDGSWFRGTASIEDRGVLLRVPLAGDGRFVFRGLPAGAYRVRVVSMPEWEPDPKVFLGEATLATGTTDTVIDLRPAPDGTEIPDPTVDTR